MTHIVQSLSLSSRCLPWSPRFRDCLRVAGASWVRIRARWPFRAPTPISLAQAQGNSYLGSVRKVVFFNVFLQYKAIFLDLRMRCDVRKENSISGRRIFAEFPGKARILIPYQTEFQKVAARFRVDIRSFSEFGFCAPRSVLLLQTCDWVICVISWFM